jgi:hypothetical protein
MLPVIKYFWPLWIGLILQFFTAFAGEFLLGENSAFVDWVFGRNCNQGLACGGNRWLLSMWSMVAVLAVINATVWGITNLVKNYRNARLQVRRVKNGTPAVAAEFDWLPFERNSCLHVRRVKNGTPAVPAEFDGLPFEPGNLEAMPEGDQDQRSHRDDHSGLTWPR